MKFNNVENPMFRDENGKAIFHSRSVAAIIYTYFLCDGKYYIPLAKRLVVNNKGKFGVVAGYLDWNETIIQCAIRECYEELGIDLTQFEEFNETTIQPIKISSDFQSQRQDVTFTYEIVIKVDKLPNLIPQPSETSDVCYLPLTYETLHLIPKDIFAFNAYSMIIEFYNKVIAKDTTI